MLAQIDPGEPLTPADEKIIGACLSYASRHLSPGLTRDDLRQTGRLALLIARGDGRVPTDPLHREKYTARRVLGAMLDANRAAWHQQPVNVDELTDETPRQTAIGQPDAICEARQAVARLFKRGSAQMLHCMELLAAVESCEDAAAALGVHPSRVSQLKAGARALVARCW